MGPDLTLLKKSLEEADISSLFLGREIDNVIVELVDFLNPVRQSLQRRPGSGKSYLVRKRAAGVTPATFVSDTGTFTEETGSYTDTEFQYRTLGTQGKVSRRVQKTGRLLADLLREEMEAKAREVRDQEEKAIFFGNSPDVVADEFGGLNERMNANTGQIVALTNTGTGVDLTLAKLDEAIDLNIGNPGLIVTSRTGRRKINALLQSQQRFIDRTEIAGGFRVTMYNDIPVVASTQVPDTLDITTGGTISALTGGSSTAIFIIDLQDVFMSVLSELSVLPLARRSSQFQEFDIFMDEALVVRDDRHVSLVTGLKAKE